MVLRYLYTGALPEWEDKNDGGGEEAGTKGGKDRKGGKAGKAGKGGGGGKAKGGKEGKGKEAEDGPGKEAAGAGRAEVREVVQAADMFQAEGLLKHSLEEFRKGLTVETAAEGLVWAHLEGPEAARRIASEFVVANGRRIQVCFRALPRSCFGIAFPVYPQSGATYGRTPLSL